MVVASEPACRPGPPRRAERVAAQATIWIVFVSDSSSNSLTVARAIATCRFAGRWKDTGIVARCARSVDHFRTGHVERHALRW